MPCTRRELEELERTTLAPFAQLSSATRGREHEEVPPEWRTQYQRDRDRIIHSRAFRRLEYKTQVFLNGTGDHLRTRLTHTMEVAAIARNVARALRLNEDLTEAIALAHDLGHSPFGHNGEAVLNDLMREQGGFEHNRQSRRIVELLERKYPGFPGLNLTWEVREGLAKHEPPPCESGGTSSTELRSPSLEAQVADVADEIAYYSHDLDDGLDAGLLSESTLAAEVRVWAEAADLVRRDHGRLADECRRYFIIRCVIDRQVHDVVETAEARIAGAAVERADEVRARPEKLVGYSGNLAKLNRELRSFLYNNLYYNEEVHGPNARAVKMLRDLFQYYLAHPPEVGAEGVRRTICDRIAGMTDRSALEEHRRLISRA